MTQKQKQPKSSCRICSKKVKEHCIICASCGRLLGEDYTEQEILNYYHRDKRREK